MAPTYFTNFFPLKFCPSYIGENVLFVHDEIICVALDFISQFMINHFVLFPKRKGKFLHHYENYGATSKDIADWLKK